MENIGAYKGNILIAEFMEFQKTTYGWFDSESYLKLPYTIDNTFDELLFNSSYDWLIPVIYKIDTTINDGEMDGNDIFKDWFGCVNDAMCSRDIEDMYIFVIDFIEWYNLNNIKK